MHLHRLVVLLAVLFTLLAVGLPAGSPAAAAENQGIEFRDLVGTNTAPASRNKLWENSVGYNRLDVSWRVAQPSKSTSQQHIVNYIESRGGGHADRDAAYDVGFLPMLGYTPGWATDTTEKTFTTEGGPSWAGKTYHRKIKSNGQVHFYGPGVDRTHSKTNGFQPMKTQYQDEWTNYVTTAVNTLKPHGVEYYQPWNEPAPAGFFEGDPDVYMNRVSIPAAQAIHDAGGKVVFGGWPTLTGFVKDSLAPLLTKHNAWHDYDALSVHYHALPELESLRKQAAKHGAGDVGIWETEMGNTQNLGKIPSFYPRFAKWALLHNDGDPDRYKAFWYPHQSYSIVPGHSEPYRGISLFRQENSNRLAKHGVILKTIGDALSGQGKLKLYNDVGNDRGLTFELNETKSGIESFKIDNRIVVAVHLKQGEADDGTIELDLPKVTLEQVASAKRLRIDGQTIDLTAVKNDHGPGITLNVSTENLGYGGAPYPTGRLDFARSFLVQVDLATIPEPATAAVLGLGVGGLVLTTRRRSRRPLASRRSTLPGCG